MIADPFVSVPLMSPRIESESVDPADHHPSDEQGSNLPAAPKPTAPGSMDARFTDLPAKRQTGRVEEVQVDFHAPPDQIRRRFSQMNDAERRHVLYTLARNMWQTPRQLREKVASVVVKQIPDLREADKPAVLSALSQQFGFVPAGPISQACALAMYRMISEAPLCEDTAIAAHLSLDTLPAKERVAGFDAILTLCERLVAAGVMTTPGTPLAEASNQLYQLPLGTRSGAAARIRAMRDICAARGTPIQINDKAIEQALRAEHGHSEPLGFGSTKELSQPTYTPGKRVPDQDGARELPAPPRTLRSGSDA